MCPARAHSCPIARAGPNANHGAANLSSFPNRNPDTSRYSHANAGGHGFTAALANTRHYQSSNIDACSPCHRHASTPANSYSESCTHQHPRADRYTRGACGLPGEAPSNYGVIYRA